MYPFALGLFFIWLIIQLRSLVLEIVRVDISPHKKKNFTKEELAIINSYLVSNTYYMNLSVQAKVKFFNRLMRFMVNKEFVGMEGLKVTDEMRALISACAIQITFGLDNYLIRHFRSFRIYPQEFYSRLIEKHLKGGATQSGIIMLSWDDFEKGYANPSDKYNLGLHEMAHALILDMFHGTEENEQFQDNIIQWERAGDIEMEKLKKRQPHFLRAYGGTNEHEFFAVSVEHFFEAPEEFKKNLPAIYSRLSLLLNQDPSNSSGDYQRR